VSCIFCRIVAGEIPAKKVLEDGELVVFHDIQPWAPVHLLVIPREHVASLADVDERHERLLGRMMALAPKLMRDQRVTNGFRVVVNTGADGGQEVPHLHIHVMGGPRPWAKG
jgi:histidine triad (HIT) family protein